jgi:hypothetical protein
MQAHRAEATITEDGVLTLRNVPFCRGDSVEVIVLPAVHKIDSAYTLRGKPVTLVGPAEPVAEGDWETIQ